MSGRYVTVEADVSTCVDVDINPDDYPELIEWANERSAKGSPELATDTLEYVAERLRLLCQAPSTDAVDRMEMSALADDVRDVVFRLRPRPGDPR